MDAAWQRMHWWIGAMAALYAFSGITIVKSDEVAVILRWGRVVGDAPGTQEHGPGLLFAFPKPIDEVKRLQMKHVWHIPVTSLGPGASSYNDRTLNPVTEGYALTGDRNVVQMEITAHYRVRDLAQFLFYGPYEQDIIPREVAAAMVRSIGEMGVDQVLSEGRKSLIETVTKRAQEGFDAAHAGIELASLELTRLSPPQALVPAFDSVQSSFIKAQTAQNEALAYQQSAIPEAQGTADALVQLANGEAVSALADARGEAQAFLALSKEYRANPGVIKERLYRDAIGKVFQAAGEVRWVPPPSGGSYHGFRVSLSPNGGERVSATDTIKSLPKAKPAPSLRPSPQEEED